MRNLEITFEVCDCFLEYTNFRDDIMECKCSCCSKDYQQKFDEKFNNDFLIHANFLTTTIISLFYCCKKGFILMNIWMIGQNSNRFCGDFEMKF